MALTRNTTTIAKQTTGDSTTFVTGNSTAPNKILKWDSSGNAISSGIEISNESFGGNLPSSADKIPTQESVSFLINSRLGSGTSLGEIQINPTNNPASGTGGLSISAKNNGIQTITYTPPDALTADQINNTGFDNGEFVSFNAEGNLVTSGMKKNLLINEFSGDNIFPTSKAVFTYGQNIEAKRLKGIDENTINHGDFISYNSATGGFEASTASVTSHKLFSATHTDVKTNVTPSYGDSIFYSGNEWDVGTFGNYGADMEYKGITGQSGATFSELSYSDLSLAKRNMYFANGLVDAFPAGTTNSPASASNLSGNFSGLTLTSKSATSGEGDKGTPLFADQTYTISGKVQFPISGFTGTGLVNSKIRGLYIRSQIFMHAGDNNREAEMYVTYPDGSKQPLLRTDKETYYEDSRGVATNVEEIVFVPVNEGQTQIEIEFNLDKVTAEGFLFEITGALCTRRIELSPEIDVIQIIGAQSSTNQADGFVDENSLSFDNDPHVWTSVTPTISPASNWSGVFPIVIPDNVSKSVITTVNNWNYNNSSHEEIDHITITVDWNEQTIIGTYTWGSEYEETGFLYSSDLVGEKTFTIEASTLGIGNNLPTVIKFEISGRNIIKLPAPSHGGNFPNMGQKYTIENYKTIASLRNKLATGFTTVSTTGTAATDGYLLVQGDITNGNTDSIIVNIDGEIFTDDDKVDAVGAGREVLTIPIAAGESWSISSANGTVSFNVRFKAKTTELSSGPYNGEESITLPNGMIMKTGFAAEADSPGVDSSHSIQVTFQEPFPTGIVSIQATGVDSTTSAAPAAQSNVHIKPGYDVNGFTMYTNSSTTNVGNFWTVIGY